MSGERDTYKYWFKNGNVKLKCGITNDLARREGEHQRSGRFTVVKGKRYYWRDGKIHQEGDKTTRSAALDWEKDNDCNNY